MNAAMEESERLFERLAGIAAGIEPVPAAVDAGAKAAFAFRDLDAAVAALVRDSAEEPEPAGVRDSAPDRMLSFELEQAAVTVELQVGAVAGHQRDVIGQVSGTRLTAATVDTAEESRELTVDDGFFVARGLPAGPVRLCFTTEAGNRIATSWVRV